MTSLSCKRSAFLASLAIVFAPGCHCLIIHRRSTSSLKYMAASCTEAELSERYGAIAAAQPLQQRNYEAWLEAGAVNAKTLNSEAAAMGLELDITTGALKYSNGPQGARFGNGERALGALCYDLLYVRHGKTEGNTEPRVFQGYVDELSNTLNEVGLRQAQDAADKVRRLTTCTQKKYCDTVCASSSPFRSSMHCISNRIWLS